MGHGKTYHGGFKVGDVVEIYDDSARRWQTERKSIIYRFRGMEVDLIDVDGDIVFPTHMSAIRHVMGQSESSNPSPS